MSTIDLSFLEDVLRTDRRGFLKATAALGGAAALGLKSGKAGAFAYEPYPRDDELTIVPTSCAHNCGSRHMLIAHKKGDVIVRLSTDDGTFQGDKWGTDTFEMPQLRACLRGRSYRARIYSPERLLYPMIRVGARGEGKFKRASWDEALNLVAENMIRIRDTYGPTALLDQSYAGASYGVLHKSDQIEGLLGRFLGMFGCRTSSWSVPSYQGTTTSSRWTFGTIEDGNEDDTFAHAKLIIMWGWNPAYTFHGGNTFYYMRMAKQNGCKFVVVDPQYTDSAAAYDAGGFRSSPTPMRPCWRAWRTIFLPTICTIRPSSTNSAWAWMPAPCRSGGDGHPTARRISRITFWARTTGWRRPPSGPLRSVASAPRTSRSWRIFTPPPSRQP
jgi:anaerobic dimethyl sulfoxide reductase subunit A